MKTLPEIINWMKSDPVRVILVEVVDVKIEGAPSTLYLANRAYTTLPTDTIQNQFYLPCITGGISFSETLSIDGSPSLGVGDLEIDNFEGDKDDWLNYIWANKEINVFIGDVRWPRDDFYRIFTGIVSDISSKDQATLNIIILDKLERLNKPIYEEVLGGSGSNKDVVKPLLFGECFNIEPLLTDAVPNTLQYMVHDGSTERIIEVRDNGLPVLFNPTLSNGTFTLTRSPAGQITVSAQGSAPAGLYSNNIASIIKTIVKDYGPANSKLTDSDINISNFDYFTSHNIQPVGVYCKDRENVLDVCQRLASSIGASVIFDSQGRLNLVKLSIPGEALVEHNVTSDDMLYGQLTISDKIPVRGSIKLAYCKNWTPQSSGLAGGVLSTHVPVMQDEWYYANSSDSTVLEDYTLFEQPVQEDTLLLSTTDASTESTRRLNLWKTPRFIVTSTYLAHLLPAELGDTINITHPRFGMATTKSGIIIDIQRDWLNGKVVIGALI